MRQQTRRQTRNGAARVVRLTAAAATAAALALTACSAAGTPEETPTSRTPATTVPSASTTTAAESPTDSVTPSATIPARVIPPTVTGEIATGLTSPWSIAFLPDGRALVSERNTGKIRRIESDGTVTDVGVVPGVVHENEGGLLGLALSPDFETDHLLYAYFTSASDNRIVRMTYDDAGLGDPSVILDGITKGSNHNGGRIAFGPDGKLYAGVGDAGNRSDAQDTSRLNGKILRMNPDGSVPGDNPFGNLVWTYGHRNVQGLGWDSEGRMWASEFGQNTWDELNLIEKGNNYGWPVVEGQTARAGMVEPVYQWPTSEASPSGIAVVGTTVYMASLRGERLWQIARPGLADAVAPVAYFTEEYGRLRDVVRAPDGSLWLLTNNTDGRGSPRAGDDRILRLSITP